MPRTGAVLVAGMVGGSALLGVSCGSDDSLDADAGPDTTVSVGESPRFDGCGSSGEIADYRWVIRQAPPGMADDVGKAIRESSPDCSFELDAAMVGEEIGDWVIELTVTHTDGSTSSDRVTVTVTG